jgi:predicted transcriptional regulator
MRKLAMSKYSKAVDAILNRDLHYGIMIDYMRIAKNIGSKKFMSTDEELIEALKCSNKSLSSLKLGTLWNLGLVTREPKPSNVKHKGRLGFIYTINWIE